jgi:glycine/D-amino acid oxidase-like deaminating enzyme
VALDRRTAAAPGAATGPLEVAVAIVGAGYTGLWSAYYLKRADPSLRIVVRFGASGRNGGWVSGFFSGPPRVYARQGGPTRTRRFSERCSRPSMRSREPSSSRGSLDD